MVTIIVGLCGTGNSTATAVMMVLCTCIHHQLSAHNCYLQIIPECEALKTLTTTARDRCVLLVDCQAGFRLPEPRRHLTHRNRHAAATALYCFAIFFTVIISLEVVDVGVISW